MSKSKSISMDDNKYYTPTIEEFHVGFEYEEASSKMVAPKQWDKKVAKPSDLCGVTSLYYHTKRQGLDIKDLVRVKYLDREDIEELGFIFEGKSDYPPFYQAFNLGEIRLGLPHTDHNEPLRTIKGSTLRTKDLFIGEIKNKSELKSLLKQLGILQGVEK